MRVVILGPGRMGCTLAELLCATHHEVMLSAYRDEPKAWALADALGCRLGDLAAARAFGEVFFLCVPHAVAGHVLQELNPAGGLVIDCTNQFGHNVPGELRTSSELLASGCPGAVVAKAFNTHRVDALRTRAHAERPVAMAYCCDSTAGAKICEVLIRDCGYAPVDAGPLEDSAALEPGGPFFLQVMSPEQAAEKVSTSSIWERSPPLSPMY